MKRLNVAIKSMDSDTNFEIKVFDLITKDTELWIHYEEPENQAMVTVSYSPLGAKIVRQSSESHTTINCMLTHKTQALMKTVYGEQVFDVQTNQIQRLNTELRIKYKLYSNDNLIQEVIAVYQWKEGD